MAQEALLTSICIYLYDIGIVNLWITQQPRIQALQSEGALLTSRGAICLIYITYHIQIVNLRIICMLWPGGHC